MKFFYLSFICASATNVFKHLSNRHQLICLPYSFRDAKEKNKTSEKSNVFPTSSDNGVSLTGYLVLRLRWRRWKKSDGIGRILLLCGSNIHLLIQDG